MRYIFRLPDVGEGIAEAEIVAWHVAVGDVVAEDARLVDVMTDKSTIEMTSPVSGKILAIHGEAGGMTQVGSVLAEFEIEDAGNTGADAGDVTAAAPVPSTPAVERGIAVGESASVILPALKQVESVITHSIGQEPFAAPATRRRAGELGVALHEVTGTGRGGRITPEDLEAYVAARSARPIADTRYTARDGVANTRIIGLRRKIAEKMQESKRRIPHMSYSEECDVTELESLRADLNAHRAPDQPKLTLLPFFMRILVRVLPAFPQFNARYDDDHEVLHAHEGVHIAIATQTPNGLMTPVVRNAESHDIWGLATEVARAAAASRDGSATREQLSGSTITITSLGALGGVVSTPVINHPEVAILAPNKIVERPVVDGHFITVRKMMNLSSSFDHRIIDGHVAALFVQQIKRLVEHPALIFMD